MPSTKESIAQSTGLQHLLDLAGREPAQAHEEITQLRPAGILPIRTDEDLMLAFSSGRALRSLDRFEEATQALEAASSFAQTKAYTSFAADCERDLAGVYIAQDEVELGLGHAQRSLALAEAEDNPLSVAHSKQKLATLLAMKDEDELSVQNYLEAINVFERLAPTHVHSALNNYSHHFFKRGDSEAGIKLLEEAVARADNDGSRSIYLLNIATARLDLGQIPDAIEAASESIKYAEAFGRPSTVAKAKVIYAHALAQVDSSETFHDSMEHIEEAEQCFDRFEHLPSQALDLVYRAKLAALKGQCEKAKSFLDEAQSLELSDRTLWDLVFAQTIEEVQKQCANWADAYSALKQFDKISASLRGQESTRMIYANPVGTLREHEIGYDETETLRAQLDQRSKDLIAVREETAQVRSEIDSIVLLTRDRDAMVRAIRKQINTIPEREDYHTFELRFSENYPTFFSTIKALYPDLTDVQLRICVVTRAGLRSPEAAKLLNLSERTVQNHRYRIKKMFGLAPSDSLLRFLKRF